MRLDAEMKAMVERQALGFVATVCADGTPNLSPKGTVSVWDDETLVFLDLHSPGTVRNLRERPAVEINVVDPVVRKGWRFKGVATVLDGGALFDDVARHFERTRGTARSRIHHVVLVSVESAGRLISPAYDDGSSEQKIAAQWRARLLAAHPEPEPGA
jgi:predicted pyridoxine 5'-phosphate oxidase superfamily flavin-nucleotide-binding protein